MRQLLPARHAFFLLSDADARQPHGWLLGQSESLKHVS
jgi:hypothetical protein